MNILSLNPGSSTLKYTLYRGEEPVADDTIEVATMTEATASVLASVDACLSGAPEAPPARGAAAGPNAPSAGEAAGAPQASLGAVGVRVVHGGSRFVKPALVDDAVIAEIRALSDLAPLHNPLALEVIEEVRRTLRDVPVVAVFDTAFHQTMPPVAYTYAVPRDVPVRRYGFHGISYAYVSSRLPRPRLVICHLGNGASVCAIRDGRSVDTSMGFTPMEGLVMGTRSGDIDPGAILYLMRHEKSEPDLDRLLNRQSGMLGISGLSGDMRELERAAKDGDARAELALEVFAYRAAKYIGAYAAALEGLDALVFTAGIGEHSSSMRSRICARLAFLGIELDEARNGAASKEERCISRGRVEVWVIPTDEEREIARATREALG